MLQKFTLVFLLCSSVAFSQSSKTISGTVKDLDTNESIPYATIVIYNEEGIITGTSTNEDGKFSVRVTEAFSYIEVSFLGYHAKKISVPELEDSRNMEIFLKANEEELDEVLITAKRTSTQLKIDRKVINLGSDLQQTGTNILEAFDQISEIQTDINGSISLRGDENIRLLVNGKPSGMNTAELLAQIPSSSVDRIEIITSPSVKNQADGLSGIINIVLKKNTGSGLNASVNASVGTRRYGYGLNANYNFSKINFRLDASYASRDMNSTETVHQQFTNGNTRSIFTPFDFDGMVKRVNSGIDFFLNDKNELSFDFNYTDDSHSFYNRSLYFDITNEDDFHYLRDSRHSHITTTFNANYRKKFEAEGHYMELDYNLNNNDNYFPSSDFIDDSFQFMEKLQNDNTLHALALDYSLPISSKYKIETGASWNRRGIDSRRLLMPNTGTETNNTFDYNEDVYGLYLLGNSSFGKINLQVGLRFEYFESNSFNTLNNKELDLKFSNLFPSVHVSYNPNENNTLSFGYSKRVTRPSFTNVNPFQLGNPYFQRIANPSLRPEFSDNIDINYLYSKEKLNLSTSLYYRHSKDIIQRIVNVEDNGLETASYDNIGTKNAYGIELNARYKFTRFLESQLSANYYSTALNTDTYVTWTDIYSSNIIFRNTFKLTKNISADISYRHTPKRQNTFNFVEPRNRIDVAMRARFLNNRLTASCRIIDVLDNNPYHRHTVTQNVKQLTTFIFQSQTFGVLFNVNYKVFENKYKNRDRKKRDYSHGGTTD